MPKPLVTHIYTADPSAHVFEGKLWIYPSHDRETDIQFNDNGDQYDMNDYHVISLESPTSPATDHGVVLNTESVPWVSKQLWAPDCACSPHTGKYYLYFPARDKLNIFRIGVAVSPTPNGPFTPDPLPIPDSYSIDPAAFVDPKTQKMYLYFGGLWGGQLQCWQDAPNFDASLLGPNEPSSPSVPALSPIVAELNPSAPRTFTSTGPQRIQILCPETNAPIQSTDHARRFFEASWMHTYKGKYYFSYSTGDTHYIVYAIGDSPLGPFTYSGRILEPVRGWTTHHSIVEWDGKWWLFYHDCELSDGIDHLRSVKMREIVHDEEGLIRLKEEQ